MAIGQYIPAYKDVGTSLQNILDFYRSQGSSDIIRGARATRQRSSGALGEDLGRFGTEYGLGASQQLSNLGLEEAKTYTSTMENQANTWGGTSAITGRNLQGQYPWQSQESGIQRDWQRKLQEDQWNAMQEIEKQKSSAGLLGAIGGGIGSIFGGMIFNPLNALKDLISGGKKKSGWDTLMSGDTSELQDITGGG